MLLSITDVYDVERHGRINRGLHEAYLLQSHGFWMRQALFIQIDSAFFNAGWLPRAGLMPDRYRHWEILEVVPRSAGLYYEDVQRRPFAVVGPGIHGVIYGVNQAHGFTLVPYL